MTQERTTALFFEMFSGLPRQGPGDDDSTRRALALVPGVGADTRVLDLGCGTGRQTLVLAEASPARIVALDNHPPFIDVLRRDAEARGVADRIDARVGDMTQLEFPPGAFDLIWCEGAISAIGTDAGLREWHRLIAPGGHLALTEVRWLRPDAPPECAAFWAAEYPAIRDLPALLALMQESGYDTVGHFTLPASAWWDDYYRPLQQNIIRFRDRYPGDAEAIGLADQVQREIDIWDAYGAFYGYEFFVLRRR